MAEQLVFDLPVDTAFGRDDFFATEANAQAVSAIESWQDWPLNKLVLVGPAGAGKSHLARIWADVSGAQIVAASALKTGVRIDGPVCVEDVHCIAQDRAAEENLFHLHNIQGQQGYALLMTGLGSPMGWGIGLPDLASRIAGSHLVKLGAPDDGLLAAVLVKQCMDRQLPVEPGVVDYILRRVERSFHGVRTLVAQLDRLSLQRKKAVGQGMVRDALAQLEDAV